MGEGHDETTTHDTYLCDPNLDFFNINQKRRGTDFYIFWGCIHKSEEGFAIDNPLNPTPPFNIDPHYIDYRTNPG